MCYLVPGPTPCPEVAAVFYIRPAEVPTLFSVEGEAQVERQNTVVGFLTSPVPSSVPLPQKQVEGSCDLARELSDREKFDLCYGVATKNLQEVLGKYSVCDVKFT